MTFQSPLIAIPRKTTQDVDWSNPIRSIIAHSYGEDPKNYAEECSVLQRCRQDAVRGAGSDQTARDLLYKYFGQLELLELRFAEIKVPFIWNDAFTDKPTTQTSLAFEKASIIHLISSVLSSLAQTPSRSDPEGLKRAYYNTRASAGMLTYINENFLHAPSTDLSREVVQLCIGIMSAQATEIFTEKLIEEKKSAALISRSANSTAAMYNTVVEEMKEFQGKGIFDRNWLYILQIKSKLFGSLTQYYRGIADNQGGKHGIALVRFKVADNLAQEAFKQSNIFNYSFISTSTPSVPHDASSSLLEITKTNQTICQEIKEQSIKDNDLIYHEVLPSESSLPVIEKLPSSNPITIQEIYNNPEITKLIGPDIFLKLVPLAVHESASVYSEEKAKLVRNEVERVELSESELRAGLEYLGLPGIINQWKNLLDNDNDQNGTDDVEISIQVKRLAEDVSRGGSVENSLRLLDGERERCERELRELGGLLDNESRECERMRAKYTPQFTQSPSGPQTANLRSNIASNLSALASAGQSDSHLHTIWREIQPQINLLSSGESNLERTAAQIAAGGQSAPVNQGISLLDLQEDVGTKKGLGDQEKEELKKAAADAGERLDRLNKIRRERDEVLKDLKEKIQNDDVSNLLLLNRRSSGVEPQLFAAELEKFRPYQSRLSAAVTTSSSILQELEMLIKQIEKGKGIKEIQKSSKDRSKRIKEWEKKLIYSGESWSEIQAGLSKGLTYYSSLQNVIENDLKREVNNFLKQRDGERNKLVGEIETRQRLSGTNTGSPQSSSSTGGVKSLEERLAALSVDRSTPSYSSKPSFPPPPPQISTPNFLPPPPPSKPTNPYDFSNLSNLNSAFSTSSPTTNHTSPPTNQGSYGSSSYPSYNPPQTQQSVYSPPPTRLPDNPYPPPPSSQPPRPAQTSYGSYGSSSQPGYGSQTQSYPPPGQSQYSSPPPSQPQYTSPPPPPPSQPSYSSQSSYSHPPPPPSQSSYPSHPQSQPQTQQGYYPAPPQRQAYSSPPPQQPQQQQYPNYPPPTGQYQPPPQQAQQSGQGYGGYQPTQGYQQGGYQYR